MDEWLIINVKSISVLYMKEKAKGTAQLPAVT